MPRDHGRVLVAIWRDPDFVAQSPLAQRMYVLLLSQPTLNSAGVMPYQPLKWARCSAHTSVEDVVRDLAELERNRFIAVDTVTEEVLIRTFIKNDGVWQQPNMMLGAYRCAAAIESARLRSVILLELERIEMAARSERMVAALVEQRARTLAALGANPSPNPSPKGSGNPSTTPRPVSPKEGIPEGIGDGSGVGVGVGVGELTFQRSYVGGSASADLPVDNPVDNELQGPPARCRLHLDNPTDAPCRGCRTAREHREAWITSTKAAAAQAARTATAQCHFCDSNGWRLPISEPAIRCNHRPQLRAVGDNA